MILEQGLFYFLSNNTSVKALVSNRVYPARMPVKVTLPCLVYTNITSDSIRSLAGQDGAREKLIQIDAWGATYNAAKSLADVVRKALDAYKGSMSSVNVQSVSIQGERDFYESESEYYRVSVDYLINFKE